MPHIAEERQDNVSGVIVGGDYMGWQIFYDGRPQSQKYYADSEEEALTLAKTKIETRKQQFYGYPCYLYPDPTKWEIRLWP